MTAQSTSPSREPVAVITGGGGGVGLACAERLAATHRVVLGEASGERLASALERLRTLGHEAVGVQCDVTDVASVGELARAVADAGDLRVLVNSAGLSPSMADPWTILDVNLFGTIHVLDAMLPLAGRGTAAVCIASIAGWRRGIWTYDALLADPLAADFRARLSAEAGIEGHPGRGYALSKRAVILLVERRAHDWGRRGARLVSISPGLVIDTPMGRLEAPRGASGLLSASSLQREASAVDIANACAMLSSPDAAYVTGVDLRVDGGSIAGYLHHADVETLRAWDDPAY